LGETFPVLVPRLPAGARADTLNRLKSLAKDPRMKEVEPSLRELIGKLAKPTANGKAP
jgi:hypothetical protein